MTSDPETRIGLLGTLELRRGDGEPIALGGAKQRALLAVLLLEAGQPIPVEELVDELWHDDPPPSASHSLEAYVSRLRQALTPLGVALRRHGAGYVADLGDAHVDVAAFDMAEREASAALDVHATNEALDRATTALALWRGPALEGEALGPRARVAVARLEERRLRLVELALDAELALGRHAEAVAELQALVAAHPFRERFVARLMLALYRCGRHTEALGVYEQTRVALDASLGLQPSPELQRLSARIVRHDPTLDLPAISEESVEPARRRRKLSVALVAAGLASAVMAVGAGGSDAREQALAAEGRIALVLPRAPAARGSDLMRQLREAARLATVRGDVELQVETLVLDGFAPDRAALRRFTERLRLGAFELVVWVGDGAAAKALAPAVAPLRNTTFVYVGGSLAELGLEGVPNASAIRFADEESSELMGYLTGLVSPRSRESSSRVDVVGIVAGPGTPAVLRAIRGFERGLRAARPGARLLVDHAPPGTNERPCEAFANDQIDRGADVVVSMAAECGLGALAVASSRDVMAIGDDEADRISARQRETLLAHTYRDVEIGVADAIDRYVYGSLAPGVTRVLGLAEDYSVGVWFNDAIPPDIASRVIDRCSEIRERSRTIPAHFD